MTNRESQRDYLVVLAMVGGGLIAILLGIIAGLFGWFASKASQPLPNWAENVLVSIATACALKLGDVLSALVALATGRQVENLGQRLSVSTPPKVPAAPQSAIEGANQAAGAAVDEAEKIEATAQQEPLP